MSLKRHLIHTQSLEQRLGIQAERLRKEARGTPPGIERQRLVRKARLAETGSHLSEWQRSPGLRAPT
ncbi:hypothetical protein HAP48_0044885 [Bradyrhizobium septentrionale]|nr:hypothetical protein [Bradyrhizobium septentrionale]UGY15577.1 hypothetical protein HAP48_0044885 [Bradyrhizobium septentrionale]UGY24157.1 hypothetical protein HU675_0040545 [Bradyrhizobium septentrionale]